MVDVIQGEIPKSCNFCGESSGADGILGTGICLSSECRARMNQSAESDAALKQAQAAALSKLSADQKSSGISTGAIIGIVAGVLVLGVLIFLLVRKKSK